MAEVTTQGGGQSRSTSRAENVSDVLSSPYPVSLRRAVLCSTCHAWSSRRHLHEPRGKWPRKLERRCLAWTWIVKALDTNTASYIRDERPRHACQISCYAFANRQTTVFTVTTPRFGSNRLCYEAGTLSKTAESIAVKKRDQRDRREARQADVSLVLSLWN